MQMNMIPEYQGRIAFRLGKNEREKIEALIKAGRFRSISTVVRAAITEFLAKQN